MISDKFCNSNAPLVVGNWKMHKTAHESKEHVKRLRQVAAHAKAGVWLAVPFTAIAAAAEAAHGSPLLIGAQNMSDLMAGALTGEISAAMLIEAGATFVILGHSERRQYFNETDEAVNRKIKLALREGLQVILCIGEKKEEKEQHLTKKVLQQQLKKALASLPPPENGHIKIAYEPIWAIGAKQSATLEIIEENHALCKNCLSEIWGASSKGVQLLYGGAVTPENAGPILRTAGVDGVLVGGASLDVGSFQEIIQQAGEVQP
jgi:triosephosphate isomerase